jgi:hypothetical protein
VRERSDLPAAGRESRLLWCALVSALLGYALLFGQYRPSEIDDAWTASYVWNLTHNGSTADTVFGLPSNIRYFGHIHARLAGFVADISGWNKAVFHAFNLICMLGAALAWGGTIRKVSANGRFALLCVLLCFLLEPFIGAAYKSRSDAMAFLLVSAGVCAAAYDRFFLAALLCSFGVEVHPIAVTGYFQTAAFLLRHTDSPKRLFLALAGCTGGCIAGFCVYRFMHPEPIREIIAYLVEQRNASSSFNALTAHYFTRAYFRFIPELLFFIGGIFLYFYDKRRFFDRNDTALCLFYMTLLASLFTQRANFHYIIFYYPPLMYISFIGYRKSHVYIQALYCIMIYALVLIIFLFATNFHVDHARFDENMAKIPFSDEKRAIIGPTNAWYVLRSRSFYASFAAMKKNEGGMPESIYYIKSIYTEQLPSCAKVIRRIGPSFSFNLQEVQAFDVDLSLCRKDSGQSN